MRDYLNISDSPNSYCGIIQKIYKDLSTVNPVTSEGKSFMDGLTQNFFNHIENNQMPLLYIGGVENKQKYLSFINSEPQIANFGANLSNYIKLGDYNLLINLCAEEHFRNNGTFPEWLESDLKGTSEQCKQDILTDTFEGLRSDLYENIKSDLVGSGEISIDETAEMYDKVVSKIKNHILTNSIVDTVEGQKFLDTSIPQLFESNTPLLDLREFKTNAQQVAPHDAKLMDILKFVNKNVKNSPSLNVLINLAKEEHLQNVNRADQPENDETVKALKDYWSAGDSEIEQAIKNGIFNGLQSNLLMNLKSDMIPDSNDTKILSIPAQAPVSKLMESIQDLQVFSPIGVLWDDEQSNQKYAFVEDDVFQVTQENDSILYQSVNPQSLQNVPKTLTRFTDAIKELSYDPITLTFKPALSNWDFNIEITETGDVVLKQTNEVAQTGSITTVEVSDVKQLFVETLNILKQTDISPEQLNDLQRDADNFVIVAMNYKKLYLFDDLIQIQSLFENTYAIVPGSALETTEGTEDNVSVIVGSVDKTTNKYKSYQELVNAINKNIGLKTEKSVNKIFESTLAVEFNKNFDRQSKIGSLKEEQTQLNIAIQSKSNLMKLADENSPAQQKLEKELTVLNESLDQNLNTLNYYINNFNVLKDSPI